MIAEAVKFMVQERNFDWVTIAVVVLSAALLSYCLLMMMDNNDNNKSSSRDNDEDGKENDILSNYYGDALTFLIRVVGLVVVVVNFLILTSVLIMSETIYSNLEVRYLAAAAALAVSLYYFFRGIYWGNSSWVSTTACILSAALGRFFSLSPSSETTVMSTVRRYNFGGSTRLYSSSSKSGCDSHPPSGGGAIIGGDDDGDSASHDSMRSSVISDKSHLDGSDDDSAASSSDKCRSSVKILTHPAGCDKACKGIINFKGLNFHCDSCSSLVFQAADDDYSTTPATGRLCHRRSSHPVMSTTTTTTGFKKVLISYEGHRASSLDNNAVIIGRKSSSASSLQDAIRMISEVLLPRDGHQQIRPAATGILVDSSTGGTTDVTTETNQTTTTARTNATVNNTTCENRKGRAGLARPADTVIVNNDGACASTNVEIMCVEADKVQRLVIEKLLGKYGFRLTSVVSGEQALECLATRHSEDSGDSGFPAIVLMDVMLPGIMSGFDASEAIRREYPSAPLPIIMLTDGRTDTTMQALRCGATDVVENIHVGTSLMAGRIFAQLSAAQKFCQRSADELATKKNKALLQEILSPPSSIERIGPQRPRHSVYVEHEEVSFVFTHIVGFTDMLSSTPRPVILKLLDDVFNEFDSLSKKHGVYKIESIGDCYMLVAGHEKTSKGDHALRAVHIAAEMLDTARGFKMPNGEPLRIQAGIHSGPAFSGVIRSLTPRHSFFGDTVNVASRMGSTSFAGCIQLSSSAHDCYDRQFEQLSLRHSDVSATSISGNTYPSRIGLDCPHLEIVRLGKREIKGKGEMDTSLVMTGDWATVLKRSVDSLPISKYMLATI